MSFICDNCGKKTVFGNTQRHKRGVAGKRWSKRAQKTSRTFSPNIQKATVMIGGVPKQIKICTKCLKKFKKDGKIKTFKTPAIKSFA